MKKDYNTTLRPWYTAAVNAQQPIWSPPYVFAEDAGVIGLTYSIPIYAPGSTTLIGVIGIDFTLGAAARVMQQFGNSGTVYYATETAASPMASNAVTADYNMLVSSSMANALNDDASAQNKATNLAAVQDYMISTSAVYMADNTAIYDGSFTTAQLECSVLNYNNFGLVWRFVGASYQYPTTTPTIHPTAPTDSPPIIDIDTISGDSDFEVEEAARENVILGLTSAILVVVILHVFLSIFYEKKGAAATRLLSSFMDQKGNGLAAGDANNSKL